MSFADMARAFHGYPRLPSPSYQGDVEVCDASRRRVKVWLIDDTTNMNKWGVTEQAIKASISTIIGKPLLGPPEAGHGPDPNVSSEADVREFEKSHTVGTFIDAHSNGSAYGIAEITDPKAWQGIQSGDWKYVSPRVTATCPVEYRGGNEILPCFKFEHSAFVDSPAFGEKAAVLGVFGASQEQYGLALAVQHLARLALPASMFEASKDYFSMLPAQELDFLRGVYESLLIQRMRDQQTSNTGQPKLPVIETSKTGFRYPGIYR